MGYTRTGGGAEILAELQDSTYGLSALETLVDDIETRLTAARAANLDNLVDEVPYQTREINTYPAGAAGATPSSAASGWGFGSWVEVVPASTITNDFVIVGVNLMQAEINGPTMEALLEIGTGAAASEVTKIQMPWAIKRESSASAGRSWMISTGNALSGGVIGHKVPANTRVAARIADSSASARAYLFQQRP